MRGATRKVKKDNRLELIKTELLTSIIEHTDGEEDYLELNKEVRNANEPQSGIALVNKCENLLKETKKKFINIVGKQDKILKGFRGEDEFFDCIGLSRSNIYFKISLYKMLPKFPLLKNSILTSSYFKSNFKLIKNCARQM